MPPTTLDRWNRLCLRAGLNATSSKWHERLTNAWNEPQRHYHNLEHLEECLRLLDEVAPLCQDAPTVELAIWFHDAIYDPRAVNNEERSAAMAMQCLSQSDASEALRHNVEQLILATKTHDAEGSPDTAIMLDIDLSVLGSSRQRFSRYEEDVRREFAWVPAATFAAKRAAILEGFLGRRSIYQTSTFRERFEACARENLRWSIEQLRGSASA